MERSKLQESLVQAALEAQELAGTVCPRVERLTPAQFLRDFVMPNKPCIITGLMKDWPAMRHWTDDDYLRAKLGDKKVSINVTPNGRGDAVTPDGYFAMPEERLMSFDEFLGKLREKDTHEVCYLSHQNDNLRQQIGDALAQDVPASISFVDEALGCQPDAVNIWMGDERAVTTLHKDHYENLYAVVKGSKTFTLFPPSTLPLLYPAQYIPKVYRKEEDMWMLVDSEYDTDGATRTWISVDPQQPDLKRFPLFKHAKPTSVRLLPGEVLYLPAMWFHQVAQADGTVAVNYWYDMVYGDRYCSHKLLETLVAAANSQQSQ